MLVIQDEELGRRLLAIAKSEHRPIEEVLRSLLAQYPEKKNVSEAADVPLSERVKQVRRKAYTAARHYWQSVGDLTKATLTDDQLDEQFGVVDEAGVPRLKAEPSTLEPPVGSMAYAAKIAEEAGIHTGNPIDASQTDDVLDAEFADELFRRMRGEHRSY